MEKLEVAKSFFQPHLEEELLQAINWDTLQIADAVRKQPGKKPSYPDITYHALTKAAGNAYFHVEQERTIDKNILERIWQYNLGFISKHKSQGHNKLPLYYQLGHLQWDSRRLPLPGRYL